jgi:Carboxypeptidase regulatory-like domain
MRNLLLAGIVLIAAACGGYAFPGASPSPQTGTVTGRVLSVPCSPIEPATSDTPCAGRPVAGATLVFTSGGTSRNAVTNSDGTYEIQLPAGTWNVAFKSFMRVITGPKTVNVKAGTSVVADFVLDSGIRAPAPQQ